MKKKQKQVLISMMIGFVVIIPTVYLVISGISIKEIPLFPTIGAYVVILVSTFISFLIQPKVSSFSLQKRRKFLLILLGIYIAYLLIMSIIKGISFLTISGIATFIHYFFFITVFLYAFFRKDKEQKPTKELENK